MSIKTMSGGMSSAGANDSNLHANLPGTASLIAELDRKQVGFVFCEHKPVFKVF